MSNRTNSPWLWLPIALIVGVVLMFAMVPVIARTAAIAAPASFFAWFKGHGLSLLAPLAWETFVVFGLSILLPAVVALLVLFRWLPKHRVAVAACLAIGVLLSQCVLMPLYFRQPFISPLAIPWWQHGLLASLLLAFGVALGLSRLSRVTTSSSGRIGAA